MSVERIFPINRPYYDLPQVETFKEMILQGVKLNFNEFYNVWWKK